MTNISERLALTPAEAAEALDLSMPTVYALLKKGTDPLPSFRIGRKIVIPTLSLQKWLERQAEGVDDL